MKNENIILFIPMDTSNLDDLPNFQEAVRGVPTEDLVKKIEEMKEPMKYDPNMSEEEEEEGHTNADNLPGFSLIHPIGIKDEDDEFQMRPGMGGGYNEKVEVDESLTNLNKNDLKYDPMIEYMKEPFNFKEQPNKNKELDFSNVFIQYRECNKRMEWPIFTEIHCKQDCHPFNNRPWYLPCDYIDSVFIVLPYVFCSPECALGWNYESEHSDYSKRSSLFYLMYKMILQMKDVTIKPSYGQNMLKIYGGPYTIEEYRKSNTLVENDNKLIYPEILTIVPIIKQIKQKRENKGEQEYKLKRTKPIVRKTRTVFDSIAKRITYDFI